MAEQKFVTFYIDKYHFGIDVLDVREINHHLESTPVPLASPHIRGLINLRGQIVTLLDLRSMFGLGTITLTDDTHNIVLKDENFHLSGDSNSSDRVGLMVDRIGDIITVEADTLEAPPANIGDIDGRFLTQVAQLNGAVVAVLNVQELLTNHNAGSNPHLDVEALAAC
jgi:purine-binding chemotaxis protein CheW